MQAQVLAACPLEAEGSRAPLRQLPQTRPTRAEIDLGAIANNVRVMRAVAQGSRLYAVVKADAYGHGLVPVARCFEQQGVDGLCVALAEEGLTLRACGITKPILVLSGAYGEAHDRVLAAHLTPVIHNHAQAEAFARAAHGKQRGRAPQDRHRHGPARRAAARAAARSSSNCARCPSCGSTA